MKEFIKDAHSFIKGELNGLFTIFMAAVIVVAGAMGYIFLFTK